MHFSDEYVQGCDHCANFWSDAFKCSVLKNISNKNQTVHQRLRSTQWRET